jgi:hypothetical protein
MDRPTIPFTQIKRRRRVYLLFGGLAVVLLALLLLIADAIFQPRLRDDGGGEFPNPVRIAWEWFFPPTPVVRLRRLHLREAMMIVWDNDEFVPDADDAAPPPARIDPPDRTEPPDDE